MEIDKRVDTLENEFKLIRGELKQTLTGVRDYLLNLKLPPSQEAALLAAAIGGSGSDMSMEGKFSIEKGDKDTDIPEMSPEDELPAEEEAEAAEDAGEAEEGAEDAGEAGEDESLTPESELAEPPTEGEGTTAEMSQSPPPVNLMANLIRWVSSAKRQIGSEQLATFLEVYGISGQLSPELKEVILHLADITAAETTEASTAEIWSQLILELHGILTGRDEPLQPLRPFWNEARTPPAEPEKVKEKRKPSKLKLVLSGGDGEDEEFSINLKPDEEE